GLIGMWKAFEEMERLGWIGGRRPKMIAVQAEGCQPVVRAFEENEAFSRFYENAHTVAAGLRVPKPLGDFLVLQAVRESGGTAIAVSDDAMLDAVARRGVTYADARALQIREREVTTKNGKAGHVSSSESMGIGIRVLAY